MKNDIYLEARSRCSLASRSILRLAICKLLSDNSYIKKKMK